MRSRMTRHILDESRIHPAIRDAIASPKVGNTATDSIPGEVSSNHRTASRVEGFPSTMPIRRAADLERKWAGAVEFWQGGFNSEGTHIAALPRLNSGTPSAAMPGPSAILRTSGSFGREGRPCSRLAADPGVPGRHLGRCPPVLSMEKMRPCSVSSDKCCCCSVRR